MLFMTYIIVLSDSCGHITPGHPAYGHSTYEYNIQKHQHWIMIFCHRVTSITLHITLNMLLQSQLSCSHCNCYIRSGYLPCMAGRSTLWQCPCAHPLPPPFPHAQHRQNPCSGHLQYTLIYNWFCGCSVGVMWVLCGCYVGATYTNNNVRW